jgi:hypothetical protein
MKERTPELLPDIEPPVGGYARLLAKRHRRAGRVPIAQLAVPASVLASCLLVVWMVVQSRPPALDLDVIDAELYGHATATSDEGRYRVTRQATSQPEVQMYKVEREPGRD